MHKFPALPQPLRWVLGWRAQILNKALITFANKNKHCHHLDSKDSITSEHVASDGFHPGHEAYKEWGTTTAQLIAEKHER